MNVHHEPSYTFSSET